MLTQPKSHSAECMLLPQFERSACLSQPKSHIAEFPLSRNQRWWGRRWQEEGAGGGGRGQESEAREVVVVATPRRGYVIWVAYVRKRWSTGCWQQDTADCRPPLAAGHLGGAHHGLPNLRADGKDIATSGGRCDRRGQSRPR